MSFNSPEFLLFLPAVLVVFTLVAARERLRDVVLLVASYGFYMAWDWRFAGLILFSTAVDYLIGLRMAREDGARGRRVLVVLSLVLNLGLLGLFKYYNFFIETTHGAAAWLGFDLQLPFHQLILPVGISFYTFQSLSYTIDLYRREIPCERSFLKFATYVAFFPQLVAGPIVRAKDLLPQLHRPPQLAESRLRRGLVRVFRGLFKKVIIADLLANFAVDPVFADPSAWSSIDLLLGLYAYAFQIYADFSGYSDIAIGAALMLGYDLPENFNRPYIARNMREFWTRWHITLSSWLRDYLYIPLGGNRGPAWFTKRNLLITMLLGGLWHGAALNFVVWGAYHGVLLVLSGSKGRDSREDSPLRVWGQRFVCFHLVLLGWLFFRVSGFGHLMEFLRGVAHLEGGTALHPYFYALLASAFVLHFLPRALVDRASARLANAPAPLQGALYAGALLLLLSATLQSPAFIYFQF